MRSGLQPVAIPCNKSDHHRPFVAFSDVRAPSVSAFDASNGLRTPILCKKTNFAELAFYEVHRLQISQVGTRGMHDRTSSRAGA
jgi:hypothetical protein